MDVFFMLDAAGKALLLFTDPMRMMFLFSGVIIGLILGILPGIGGLVGLALMLPFTFSMDPYTAFAFLLGMAAVTSTGDTIPAVLFGVPGTAASAATVLDGLPMAKRGEAGRALAAAYTVSLMGGLFGAFLLAISIPLLRPLMLSFGSPEMLALGVFGISMVSVLSGNAPLRGLTAAGIGIMLALIGSDPQTGTLRWTMDSLYLWEGLPLVPVVLGIFALPELADLFIRRTAIATGGAKHDLKTGMMMGVRDAFKHWWLVIRCSWIGAFIGAIPGMGGSVIDWLAYGHALKTEKGARETFGKGDVRGVIASESSNNAKEGGALVPTVAFGIPGSAGMAVLLGAFLIHGLVPGPDMLTKNLQVTYAMVWSIAIANILGAGLCFAFSGQFAKIATLRYSIILPVVLCIVYIGAFNGSRNWGDLYTLLLCGMFGWTMKQLKWPRPPLILGYVLGDIIERYLFISMERYGTEWLIPTSLENARWAVLIIFAVAIVGVAKPLISDWRSRAKVAGGHSFKLKPQWSDLFTLFIIGALAVALYVASDWNYKARIVPTIVGGMAMTFAILALINGMSRAAIQDAIARGEIPKPEESSGGAIHMDISSDTEDLGTKTVLLRGALFFCWMIAFMLSFATIGIILTVPLFVITFMRLQAREPWILAISIAVGMTIFIYVLFDQLLTVPWPPSILGDFVPALKGQIPGV